MTLLRSPETNAVNGV